MKLRILSMVFHQMSLQIACLRWGIVTRIAFVWLFSTVRIQMCSQIACLRGYIVTLAAFVWLFSTVRFQMCSQTACPRRGIITLVALVWLFSIVCLSFSNLTIGVAFTWLVLSKILIHHQHIASVVSCAVLVPNWDKNQDDKLAFGFGEEKVKVIN